MGDCRAEVQGSSGRNRAAPHSLVSLKRNDSVFRAEKEKGRGKTGQLPSTCSLVEVRVTLIARNKLQKNTGPSHTL